MPELEATVGTLRDAWDPMARRGARAHVTVLFPFATPDTVDDALLAGVEPVVTRSPPRRVSFASVAESRDHVLSPEPNPRAPSRPPPHALAGDFRKSPPYQGQFP